MCASSTPLRRRRSGVGGSAAVCLLLTHHGTDFWIRLTKQGVRGNQPGRRFAVHCSPHARKRDPRWSRRRPAGPRLAGCSLFGLEHYGAATKTGDTATRRHAAVPCRPSPLRHWPRRAVFDKTNGWRFVRDERVAHWPTMAHTPEIVCARNGHHLRDAPRSAAHKTIAGGAGSAVGSELSNTSKATGLPVVARRGDEPMADRPPFIASRGMRLLAERTGRSGSCGRVFSSWRALGPAAARRTRGRGSRGSVRGGRNQVSENGAPCDLSRLVTTMRAWQTPRCGGCRCAEYTRPGDGDVLVDVQQLPQEPAR